MSLAWSIVHSLTESLSITISNYLQWPQQTSSQRCKTRYVNNNLAGGGGGYNVA